MDPSFHQKLERLRQAVATRRLTQSEIAAGTGVDQSQVSRILAGPVKRYSENVQKLCRFADTLAHEPADPGGADAASLLAQVVEGDPKIQAAIVDILRRMLALRREYEHAAAK